MSRWFPLLAACALVFALSCGGGGGSDDSNTIADRVLRIGEDVATEVEIFDGKVPDNLEQLLNPDSSSSEDPVELPAFPKSDLIGSAHVTRADGLHTVFVMYEVKQGEAAVSDAAREIFDESPWQVVGGQSSEGLTAYRFQSTQSSDLVGTVVVQPLPATETFEVVVKRDGDDHKLTLHRHAFTPVLGAELDQRSGAVVVSKLGAGEGADAGLEEGDRLVKIGDQDITDMASVTTALRALGSDEDPVTSVIYIIQITPADPVVSPFVLPDPRPIPSSFPVPALLRDGSTPVAVQWSIAAAGQAYQILLLSKETLTDVGDAYRQILKAQGLTITSDQAQGTTTTLEFSTVDNQMVGSVAIDTFPNDDSYTEATLQVQAAPGYSLANRPPSTGTPAPATATPTASAPASPSATSTP
jgi:hypothetical protein